MVSSSPRLAEFCCNGTVVEDTELGQVIQLQGDQRKNVSSFLVANKLAKKVRKAVHLLGVLAGWLVRVLCAWPCRPFSQFERPNGSWLASRTYQQFLVS